MKKKFWQITLVKRTIIIAIVIGILTTGFLIVNEKQSERFSYLYLEPSSYTNYPVNNQISFIYGVKSFEQGQLEYNAYIYIDDILLNSENFVLDPGQVYEKNLAYTLPENITFPAKVMISLRSVYDEYEVHYWVRDSKV